MIRGDVALGEALNRAYIAQAAGGCLRSLAARRTKGFALAE
jgi:hypothetical protein